MRHRILIIEDQKEVALVLQEYLNDYGFITEVAINGKEAIEKFRLKAYDILVTDFKLPDLDGITVVKTCKKISPQVRVIYLTGYNLDLRNSKVKTGAYCKIMEKPCRPKNILEAVNKILVQK
ncbi:MAG: response regulator [bacterium]